MVQHTTSNSSPTIHLDFPPEDTAFTSAVKALKVDKDSALDSDNDIVPPTTDNPGAQALDTPMPTLAMTIPQFPDATTEHSGLSPTVSVYSHSEEVDVSKTCTHNGPKPIPNTSISDTTTMQHSKSSPTVLDSNSHEQDAILLCNSHESGTLTSPIIPCTTRDQTSGVELDVSPTQSCSEKPAVPIPEPYPSQRSPSQCSADVFLQLHAQVRASGAYNFQGCQLPVPSNLHIQAWRHLLGDYSDKMVADFLEFGWPISYTRDQPSVPTYKNHKSAATYQADVDYYLSTEKEFDTIQGPFQALSFKSPFMVSPLQTVPKRDSAVRRVVVDLSFPAGHSVNDGITPQSYLGEPFMFTLPGHAAFEQLIMDKGQGCLLFKRDLSRAYRQIPVDPFDYNMLGFQWNGQFYFDTLTLHDLRRGGYTLAFQAGVSRELRQLHGDWRSDADHVYLSTTVEDRLQVPAALRDFVLQYELD